MPGSRSTPAKGGTSPAEPRAALDVLLAGSAGGTLRRAAWLDAVDQLLRPHLPPGLAAHARLANLRDGRLVFVVDAPVWHAKLRLATPELLDIAQSLGLEVTAVSVKLTTQSLQPPAVAAPRHAPMSPANQSGLAAALALLRAPDNTAAPPQPGAQETSPAPAKGAS